jgi:1-deoxy-D-xylulose-5-phosphate reductoisomerase
MDFTSNLQLDFEAPDRLAFPALDLAYEAARLGGAAPAWLSAANEIAVEAFLNDQISWSRIVEVVARVLDRYVACELSSIEELFENDATARRLAHGMVTA